MTWDGSGADRWTAFYRDYLAGPDRPAATPPFLQRPMADGGALDNKPFSWAYDLISLYLMAGVFFLVLSEAYTDRAHVSVDILQQKFSAPMIRLSEIVTCIVGIVVSSLIAYLGCLRAVDSFQSADVMAGAIPWPMWPSIGLVPLGAGLITIRLALHLIGHVLSLITGQAVIALPASHAAGETFE